MKDSTAYQQSFYKHSSSCSQPTSYVLPSSNTLANLLNPQKQQKPTHQISNRPSFYDLQEVVSKYQSQPELLKLILNGKLEEDKRRTEEAKLRAKELDLYLQKCRHEFRSTTAADGPLLDRSDSTTSCTIVTLLLSRTAIHLILYNTQGDHRHLTTVLCSEPRLSSSSNNNIISHTHSRNHSHSHSRSHSNGQSYSYNYNQSQTQNQNQNYHQQYETDPPIKMLTKDILLQPNFDRHSSRRKREMQAVTKIVETREFPYNDNYFWKNNGNTTHKKNGCRSIYYKCSNSSKVIYTYIFVEYFHDINNNNNLGLFSK
ncbi:hypothetical protein F4703DRAFT_1737348 [Phycomyces blakesleeanus]